MPADQELIEINLKAPNTPEERRLNIVGNVRLGRGEKLVPYIDHDDTVENIMEARQLQPLSTMSAGDDVKPRVRFYAVGRKDKTIRCPLCYQSAHVFKSAQPTFLAKLNMCLSCLSCCFPIFALSCLYVCAEGRIGHRVQYCDKCGGYIGFYQVK